MELDVGRLLFLTCWRDHAPKPPVHDQEREEALSALGHPQPTTAGGFLRPDESLTTWGKFSQSGPIQERRESPLSEDEDEGEM